MNKQALYTVAGKAIDPGSVEEVEIYFTDLSRKVSKKIVSFQPMFLDEKQLIAEVTELRHALGNLKEWQETVLEYIKDTYGKTDEAILKQWLAIYPFN